MSNSFTTLMPRIGVAAIVRRGNRILLGKRKGSHGEGRWGFPGGALDFGESILSCCEREIREETGIEMNGGKVVAFTEDVFENDNKHFITFYVECLWEEQGKEVQEPRIIEPEKCEVWQWFDDSALPDRLFLPIENLLKKGFSFHS